MKCSGFDQQLNALFFIWQLSQGFGPAPAHSEIKLSNLESCHRTECASSLQLYLSLTWLFPCYTQAKQTWGLKGYIFPVHFSSVLCPHIPSCLIFQPLVIKSYHVISIHAFWSSMEGWISLHCTSLRTVCMAPCNLNSEGLLKWWLITASWIDPELKEKGEHLYSVTSSLFGREVWSLQLICL